MTITTPTAVYRLSEHGYVYQENRLVGLLRADLSQDELLEWAHRYERQQSANRSAMGRCIFLLVPPALTPDGYSGDQILYL